jgi:hypothetical protein
LMELLIAKYYFALEVIRIIAEFLEDQSISAPRLLGLVREALGIIGVGDHPALYYNFINSNQGDLSQNGTIRADEILAGIAPK